MNQLNTKEVQVASWLDLPTFLVRHPQFSEGQLRWLLRDRKINGIDKVLCKVGKRIYLNEQRFAAWLSQRADGGEK